MDRKDRRKLEKLLKAKSENTQVLIRVIIDLDERVDELERRMDE